MGPVKGAAPAGAAESEAGACAAAGPERISPLACGTRDAIPVGIMLSPIDPHAEWHGLWEGFPPWDPRCFT